jgi:hypothetical protein
MGTGSKAFSRLVGLAAGAIALAGLASGCRTSPPAPPHPATQSAPGVSASTAPTVVTVTGSETVGKLGDVAPGSVHTVVFVIANPRDQVVQIRKVRADCACTSVVDQPAKIDPHGTARVTLRLEAPQTAMPLEERILVQTDDPDRKTIWLVIQARTVVP